MKTFKTKKTTLSSIYCVWKIFTKIPIGPRKATKFIRNKRGNPRWLIAWPFNQALLAVIWIIRMLTAKLGNCKLCRNILRKIIKIININQFLKRWIILIKIWVDAIKWTQRLKILNDRIRLGSFQLILLCYIHHIHLQ